jgi:hypothetical protein
MKKVLFILCFGSMIFAQQDTLITTKGLIYSGKIIKNDSKVVEFQPSGWTSTTKFGHDRIKKLSNSSGTILIENNNTTVKKTSSKILNSKVPPLASSGFNLRSASNYIFFSTLSQLIAPIILDDLVETENANEISFAIRFAGFAASVYSILLIGEAGDDLQKASIEIVEQQKELKKITEEIRNKKND